MCSSPQNRIERKFRPDVADRLGSVFGVGGLVVLLVAGAIWLNGRPLALPPGEVQTLQKTLLRVSLVPMPSIMPPLPEPIVEPEPEPLPEPVVEEEPAPLVESQPKEAPLPIVEPEPVVIPPPMEAVPVQPAQVLEEIEGEAEREEAIRTEWLFQLRRRIEQSKFYPGAARYSRETGTVILQVEILSSAEIGQVRILENTGSALLAGGALAILRRAAAKPLGTNALSSGFQVEVPITYRVGRHRRAAN